MSGEEATTVLFVLSRPGLGGMERMTTALARALDPTRHRPVLCWLKEAKGGGDGQDLGPACYCGLLRGKWDVRVAGRLCAIMRRERPAVVFGLGSGDAAFWGRLAGRLTRAPRVVWWLHSMRGEAGRLNRALVRWTDAVVALSPRHGEYVSRAYGVPAAKVAVVPNGVDWAAFQNGRREAVRESLGLSAEEQVVGAVGGLRPVKGYDVLVRAAAGFLRQGSGSRRLVIVGEGEMREPLRRLAEELGIGGRVMLLGARRDVPELLSAFDVFALSSRSEAFPLSVLEAMATGLPVVATEVGCLSEVVRPGETGMLAAPGRPEALAEAIGGLLADPALAREMGRRGREVVREEYTLARSAKRLEALVERLVWDRGPVALDN